MTRPELLEKIAELLSRATEMQLRAIMLMLLKMI